jgi:hypothetical protein
MASSRPLTARASVRALGHHLDRRDDPLALHMSAALGRHLVLDKEAGDAGPFEGPHGARHVGGVAIAGVAIGEQRQFGGVAQPAIHVGHLGHGELGDVGRTQQARGRGIAAAGDGLKSGLLGEANGERIMGAGQDQNLRRLDQQAKARGPFHGAGLRTRLRGQGSRAGDSSQSVVENQFSLTIARLSALA